MKQCAVVGIIILSTLWQVSCTNLGLYPSKDYTQENWQNTLQSTPNQWAQGADRWFLSGMPNRTEEMNRRASSDAAISTMKIRVPNFRNIAVNGGFQVQIFGTDEPNTVFVFGPNKGVRATAVDVRDDTLYVAQTTAAPGEIDKVIIRIGTKQLDNLLQKGCGRIETFRICSPALTVTTLSSAGGDIYLAGNIKLKRVSHAGSGNINIFDIQTPALDIESSGTGAINISGVVGVHSINHVGEGDINIAGANTDMLNIDAAGKGRISIRGLIELKQIRAKDNVSVDVYVNSNKVKVFAYNKAQVGLAGNVRELYVETYNSSSFLGRNLQTQNAFVRAKGSSHINVTSNYELYASAGDSSSVYYFGPARLAAKFATENGTIIPIGFDPKVCLECPPAMPVPLFRGAG